MWRWTFKSIWQQKNNFLTSTVGVASAFILCLSIEGIFLGESRQIISYIENTQPDLWVMQSGVSNMHMASSSVLDWKADKIKSIEGIKKVTPILYLNSMVSVGGRGWFSYIVGLKENDSRAGPWSMAEGKPNPERGEIVLPVVLKKINHVILGDEVTIADKAFKVVGFSQGTFSMANSVVFVHFQDLEILLSAEGTVSYILVDLFPHTDTVKVKHRIQDQIDKVNVLSHKQFVVSDFEMAMMMGVEIISFISIIGSILAILIVGFSSYMNISKRRKELAIIKALGFNNSSIYLSATLLTLSTTGVGYLLAIVTTFLLNIVIGEAVPQVNIALNSEIFIRLGLIAFVVGLLSSMIPARSVAKVDPMSAFKV